MGTMSSPHGRVLPRGPIEAAAGSLDGGPADDAWQGPATHIVSLPLPPSATRARRPDGRETDVRLTSLIRYATQVQCRIPLPAAGTTARPAAEGARLGWSRRLDKRLV
jgi:hypothetical protein